MADYRANKMIYNKFDLYRGSMDGWGFFMGMRNAGGVLRSPKNTKKTDVLLIRTCPECSLGLKKQAKHDCVAACLQDTKRAHANFAGVKHSASAQRIPQNLQAHNIK